MLGSKIEGLFQIEGMCGIRPWVTFDAMSNSPSHSQLNTRKFGRRICNLSEVT